MSSLHRLTPTVRGSPDRVRRLFPSHRSSTCTWTRSQTGIITFQPYPIPIFFLPLESLDSVANERPAQERAELFGCLQPGSLSGAPGRKNHRHREVHAAFSRLRIALPGLAGWENPGMSGPARFTIIALRVNLVNFHQLVDGEVTTGQSRNCPYPTNGRGRKTAETWMEMLEAVRSIYNG